MTKLKKYYKNMNELEKNKSFNEVIKFIQHLGLDKTLKYHNKINCEVSTDLKYGFYTDSIDIEIENLWGYVLIFYPYLNQFGLGNKINSNYNCCVWDSTENILRVEIGEKIFMFKK